MGNKAEQFSRGTIESGRTPPIRHSMNQKVLKGMRERQGKGEESPKVKNAARRQLQEERFREDFSNHQLSRSLRKVILGDATPEDLNHIDRFGYKVDEFISEKGNRVTITIVNLPSAISILKEETVGQEEKSVA